MQWLQHRHSSGSRPDGQWKAETSGTTHVGGTLKERRRLPSPGSQTADASRAARYDKHVRRQAGLARCSFELQCCSTILDSSAKYQQESCTSSAHLMTAKRIQDERKHEDQPGTANPSHDFVAKKHGNRFGPFFLRRKLLRMLCASWSSSRCLLACPRAGHVRCLRPKLDEEQSVHITRTSHVHLHLLRHVLVDLSSRGPRTKGLNNVWIWPRHPRQALER